MRLPLVLLLVFVTGLIACRSNSAFRYSEKIVSIERSLAPAITTTDQKITDLLARSGYDSIAIVSRQMEGLVAARISEIEKLEPPRVKEAGEFKRATIRYFHYISSVYAAYTTYAAQTNEADRETMRRNLVSLIGEKEDVIRHMQEAQLKYARANGFRIDTTK